MGRYVILLIAPVIIGFLIAAVTVAITELRRRRMEAGGTGRDVNVPNHMQVPSDSTESEEPDVAHRRIA